MERRYKNDTVIFFQLVHYCVIYMGANHLAYSQLMRHFGSRLEWPSAERTRVRIHDKDLGKLINQAEVGCTLQLV